MTKEREGEILMIGLTVLESWFPILSIVAISHIGALHTYALSLLISLFFFIVIIYKRDLFGEFKNKNAYKDLLLTSFWITTLFIFVFLGMRYTTAGNMSVIIFLQLLFAYLYFNVFGSDKMNRVHSLGALIMGVGAIIILFPKELSLNKGDLLILIGAMIAPVANFYSKRARELCSSETVLGFRTIVALPVVFFMAYIFEPSVEFEDIKKAFVYILLIGFFILGLSKILWMEALHRVTITKISAMMALVPVMTLFFAYIYLGEVPSGRQLLGVLPVLIGGYLLTKPVKKE